MDVNVEQCCSSSEDAKKGASFFTMIVCENPKRSQNLIRAAAKASAVCSTVGSQMLKAVILQAAIS